MKYCSEPIPEEISGLGSSIVDSTINIYEMITSQLLPTPNKSHYTFNLRDLSKVFQGMLMMDIKSIEVSLNFLWSFNEMLYYLVKTKVGRKQKVENCSIFFNLNVKIYNIVLNRNDVSVLSAFWMKKTYWCFLIWGWMCYF